MNVVDALAWRATASLVASPRPFFIAVCGGADTGKSTLAGLLCQAFLQRGIAADWISTDSFLDDRDARNKLGLTGYSPASIDSEEMLKAIAQLSCGSGYAYFPYVNRTGTRSTESRTAHPRTIVVVEGIHALHHALVPDLDYKIFIDAAPDVLRRLRVKANRYKRGMDAQDAGSRVDLELQDFAKYTAPARRLADSVVNVTEHYDYRIIPS